MNIKTHKNTIRVYAEDVDFMGIVYHANYLCYLERSRTEVLRAYNLLLSDLSKTDVLFAISELSINYRAPARLDDLLTVTTAINELKSCSFIFDQKIVNQHEQTICEALVKVVCVNKDLKPRRLPDIIRD
jgi:acyl-CoA thioester hydrolase